MLGRLLEKSCIVLHCVLVFLAAIPFDSLEQNSMVAMALTEAGGHIGFMEGLTVNRTNYLDRIFIQFSDAIFKLGKQNNLNPLAD